MTRPAPAADVAIVGDGPAGLALGAACVAEGLETIVLGNARPWSATYATWVDEVPDHAHALASVTPIDVVGVRRRRLGRDYGVFDNARLRDAIDRAPLVLGDVVGVEHDDVQTTVITATGERVAARLVVDATGSVPALLEPRRRGRGVRVVQSALGVVLAERPRALDGDAAVLMDWRQVGAGEPTFLYVAPLAAGRWLVEETSLARREPMAESDLRARLATRLGRDVVADAEHVERVLIPMASGVPRRSQRVVGFGAAAGYVHPATGYSVAASLRAAPRVAAAIARSLGRTDDPRTVALDAWNAVWPGEQRRARALHDYGLQAILRMSADEIRTFFDAFFALPESNWSEYLRVDTTPGDVARAMREVFRSVPWGLRRRLALGSPASLAGLMR